MNRENWIVEAEGVDGEFVYLESQDAFYRLSNINRDLVRVLDNLSRCNQEMVEVDRLIETTDGNVAPLVHEREVLAERAESLSSEADELFLALTGVEGPFFVQRPLPHANCSASASFVTRCD